MGMFDYVICEYPLPEVEGMDLQEFQTKSFNNRMETYLIDRGGKLSLHKETCIDIPERDMPLRDTSRFSGVIEIHDSDLIWNEKLQINELISWCYEIEFETGVVKTVRKIER